MSIFSRLFRRGGKVTPTNPTPPAPERVIQPSEWTAEPVTGYVDYRDSDGAHALRMYLPVDLDEIAARVMRLEREAAQQKRRADEAADRLEAIRKSNRRLRGDNEHLAARLRAVNSIIP